MPQPSKARRAPKRKTPSKPKQTKKQPNTRRSATSPGKTLSRRKVNYLAIVENLGQKHLSETFERLQRLTSLYPRCPRLQTWIRKLQSRSDLSRVVGDAGLSQDVTTLTEAPFDLPPVPYNNSTPIQRKCMIQKIANQGTVGGGLSAYLTVADLANYTEGTSGVCRVKQVTSWTIPRYNSGASAAEFSSVNVPLQSGSAGTEVVPVWESNFTRVGQGFSGLVTKFPLGDLPLFVSSEGTTNILQHFVGDGFTSGSATDFLSVVFDVLLECLI